MISTSLEETDVVYGSYGLDQCLTMVEEAMKRPGGINQPPSPDWLVGEGVALSMIDTVPPGGHFSNASLALRDDGTFELVVGTAEFGNGTATVHRQIAATVLGTTPENIVLKQSDTDHDGHDTGAYGSTGTVVAGRATLLAAEALRDRVMAFAGTYAGGSCNAWISNPGQSCAMVGVSNWRRSPRPRQGPAKNCRQPEPSMARRAPSPSTFRRSALPSTRRLERLSSCASVHAADAGRVVNPMQCRGQVEGGVAQSLGSTLYEEMLIDNTGRVVNPTLRNYHIPTFADVPRTEVMFADTRTRLGRWAQSP